ncbi:hypothetical protein BOX15_Mlig003011g1 [Macrostomum lignano]|uniref:Uncharacterized protein n=1 Tax=Macrostomum lignano TaxID=282301 RepID=A0A267EJY2_9PLAT|nr:hypothetical protein BOX15_Mlig003011g2 [Macrostomum lignano]PAA61820.1 hypothetical protein BOX15_Mlig003011g1 [Macrostomum lignano]
MPDDQPVFTIDNSLAEETMRSFVRRHWTTVYFCIGLLVHIGCLVVLHRTETNSETPPQGYQLTLQRIAALLMYVNVIAMALMVLLDSHLSIRWQRANSPLNIVEEDSDLPMTKSEAEGELRLISKFSRKEWEPVMNVVGHVSKATIAIFSWVLTLAILVNIVTLFIPPGIMPSLATQATLFSLAIPGLLCLLACLLFVLHHMYFKYRQARKTFSRTIINMSRSQPPGSYNPLRSASMDSDFPAEE